MVEIGGMNNSASPVGLEGFATVSAKNLDFFPRGSISRRRGFRTYVSTWAYTKPALFDLFLYDRFAGASTRVIDLAARTSAGSLLYNRIFLGATESTGGDWASMSAAGWASSTLGGQAFLRENLAYYSCGSTLRGFTGPSTSFGVGLAIPTGLPIFNAIAQQSRMGPGYYDYTFTSYSEQRHVESLPRGFVRPSTVNYFGTSTPSITNLRFSLGYHPGPVYSLGITGHNMTFDTTAATVNIYRRHPFTAAFNMARRIDDIRLLMSRPRTASSWVDRMNDMELGGRLTYAGSPPRAWKTAAEFQQRWWYVYPSEPWRMWFSEVDAPEMVAKEITISSAKVTPLLLPDRDIPFQGEAWLPIRRNAGPIEALAPFGSVLLVLCSNQTWRLSGNSPGTFDIHPIDETIGCVAPRSAITTPFGALWISQQGITWWRGGKPIVVSKGVLDFDDALSAVRLNRAALKFAVAAYDPVREQAEFAVPSYSSGGNDIILCLDLGISTQAQPVFTWHQPQLGTNETITAMTTAFLPTKEPFVVYTTSHGRTLHRSGTRDDDGTSLVGIPWELEGWMGQETGKRIKANVGVRLTQDCGYGASVAASLWSRQTARVPQSGEAQTTGAAITCSSRLYGAQEFGVRGNFLYLKLRETASSPFEIQDLSIGANVASDWRNA